MIAFSSGNTLDTDGCGGDWAAPDGPNYILSIVHHEGYCISKILVTSLGVPRYLTFIIMFNSQADIAAVPELLSSAYVPWRSACRLSETAHAFLNAGLCEQTSSCVAIAINIIYDVLDRNFIDYTGSAKDCICTSSGLMELDDECKERIFSVEHVLSEFPFAGKKSSKDDDLPF